jgi:hypothetical protein
MHSLLDIEFSNLPDECNNELDLETIGILIQNVISEVEERMPEYEGEYLDTTLCPLPESNTTRRLQKVSRRLAGTYTYKGTGRCRRCLTRNTDRRLQQNRFLAWFGFGQRHLQSDCAEETETVTIQKDLAEAAVQTADTVLLDLTDMAKDFQENKDVKSIIALAESTNPKVKAERTLASIAAELTISLCSQAATSRIDDVNNTVQDAMADTVDAVRRAQDELEQLKKAKRDMEELISILAAKPEINMLETALEEEKAELVKQIDTIDAEIADVDAALEALDVNVTVIYADSTTNDTIKTVEAELERVKNILEVVENAKGTGAIVMDRSTVYYVPADKVVETTLRLVEEQELLTRKATLLEEKLRLEQAVESNEELISRSSDSIQSLYPEPRNFTTDPVLQYALELIDGDVYGSKSNWDSDPYAEPTNTREEWFAKFARLLILEIPNRLGKVYNTTTGGCIDGSLDMLVIITELETMDKDMARCNDEALLASSSMEDAALTESSPTVSPMVGPTSSSTTSPTAAITLSSSFSPTTPSPSAQLKPDPTVAPMANRPSRRTTRPTVSPTSSPTDSPMFSPTIPGLPGPRDPTAALKASPAPDPSTPSPIVTPTSSSPMVTSTGQPKPDPTTVQTAGPAAGPMLSPTANPTTRPRASPSAAARTVSPTMRPTASPTPVPTSRPTASPTSAATAGGSVGATAAAAAVSDLTAAQGSNSTPTKSPSRPTYKDTSKDNSKDNSNSNRNSNRNSNSNSNSNSVSRDRKDRKDTKVTKVSNDSKDSKDRRILKWRKQLYRRAI